MPIGESFAQHINIQKIYKSMQPLFSNVPSIFRQSEILENYRIAASESYTDLIPALQQSVSSSVAANLKDLSNSISAAIQAISPPSDLKVSIPSSLQNSLSAVEWYPVLEPIFPIMEEVPKADNCDAKNIVQRIKERKPLSSSQLISILEMILTILSLWLSLQSNPQTDKVIQQNERIIEQEEIQIQQNKEIIAFLEKS